MVEVILSAEFLAGEHLQIFSLWAAQWCPAVAGSDALLVPGRHSTVPGW